MNPTPSPIFTITQTPTHLLLAFAATRRPLFLSMWPHEALLHGYDAEVPVTLLYLPVISWSLYIVRRYHLSYLMSSIHSTAIYYNTWTLLLTFPVVIAICVCVCVHIHTHTYIIYIICISADSWEPLSACGNMAHY